MNSERATISQPFSRWWLLIPFSCKKRTFRRVINWFLRKKTEITATVCTMQTWEITATQDCIMYRITWWNSLSIHLTATINSTNQNKNVYAIAWAFIDHNHTGSINGYTCNLKRIDHFAEAEGKKLGDNFIMQTFSQCCYEFLWSLQEKCYNRELVLKLD